MARGTLDPGSRELSEPDGFDSFESVPTLIPAELLMLDEDAMDRDEDEDMHDFEEELVRHRLQVARTLFHQPRGDDDTMNSTCSLYDADVVFQDIHGRKYCGSYALPIDEEEQTRLQIMHGIYLHILNNRLTTVPLSSPSKILDIGTGTGEWAMAIGEEYPQAEVIGTDIAKIQPGAAPSNVFFEIDDAEEEGGWTWPEDEFDLVHFRHMVGAFADWTQIYREAFRHLKPGGWIEVVDFDDHDDFRSYFGENPEIDTLFRSLQEAAVSSGRVRGEGHLRPKLLTDLGFVDVSILEKHIPMGVWPEDEEELKIGKHFLVAQLCGIEATCLRLLSEELEWDWEEIKRHCSVVIEAIKAVALDAVKSKGMGFNVKILVARKPFPNERLGVGTLGGSMRTMLNGNSAVTVNGIKD